MHFMVYPATFFTAAYERILFTKHSSGTVFIVAEPQPPEVSHKHCYVGRCAFLQVPARDQEKTQRSKGRCAPQHGYSRRPASETPRANILGGAGRNCSGSRAMDLFVVVIIGAIL